MKLVILLSYCASALFSKFTESATCVDTTGLTITVENDTVTTIDTAGISLSAYVNFPRDSVYVSYQAETAASDTLIFNPSREDPCRYDAQLSSTTYDENGLNFIVTFFATDKSDTSIRESDVTTVLVEVAAEVSTTSDGCCALSGETAELVCQAIGNPIPSITWSNSDNGIASTSFNQPDFPDTVSSTANLRFSNVTFQDREEYTCTVNNTVGNPPRNVTDFKIFNLDVNIAPVLISSTSDMKVDYGNSANLSCMFQAYPLPKTTWSNDNSDGYEITEVDSGQYYRTTTLEIQSVTCVYVAQYYCEASNTVCGNAMKIRSESTAIDITEPPGVENLIAEIPECDGTSVSLSWNKPDKWTGESSYYVTSNSTNPPQSLTNENITLEDLTSNTVYEFQVTVVLCNVTSVPATITKGTAVVGIPSSPINVTQAMSTDYKMCNITWIEPSVNYGAIENYEIIYYSCQVNTNDCGESFIVNTNETSYEIDMTTPNSEYYVSVSAITCAGKGENTAVNDINCISDTAAPPSAAIPNPGNGGTSVSTSSTSINVTIEPADTENGALSCYFLVMIRYSEGSNPERLELNSSYPVDQIAQANDSVNDNEPYFAIASEESGIFTVGNDLTSQCNIRGTSSTARSTTTSFTAKSRSLENGRTYDMFELTSTPSQYSDKVYYGVSDPVMILVTEIDNYDVPVVAIVVPIVVVVIILIVVGIGIWYYKKKNNQTKENLNSVQYNTEDVSRNDYKYDQKETTNYCENSGKSTARVSPTHEE